ncbi:hypothetical protein BDN71DRAFT_1507825 [Pleurotus eryngii]|uniref:Uncharacterized protein n=1 Tax=Pleurotus eryngii TaxID=5323 RepID=A0A9P5ZYW7_PLEER|nr:hypothetical protein BDN71DRAFT_1507825 [Pleurotus eryngii]
MTAPSQQLWIRCSDPNGDTTFTLEEDGWITSLQYYQKPLGTKPSLLYLRSEDEDGIPKGQDLGKLVPKKAEHLQLAVEMQAKRAYTIVNQGANPVVLHGYFDEANTLSTDNDHTTDLTEIASSSPNGPSISNVTEATAGPARSIGGASNNKRIPIKSVAKTTVTRANPTRSACQPSILIADKEKEGGAKGRCPAANKKAAEDSEGGKKATAKQKTDDWEGGKKATMKQDAEDSERRVKAVVKCKAEDSGDEMDGAAAAEPSFRLKKRRNVEETSAHSGSAANRKPCASKQAKTGATQCATPAKGTEADTRLVESLKEPKIEENQVGTGKEITMRSKVNVYYVLKIWNGATFMLFQSLTSSLPLMLITVGDSSDLFGLSQFLVVMRHDGKRLVYVPPDHVPEIGIVPSNTVLCLKVKLWEVCELSSDVAALAVESMHYSGATAQSILHCSEAKP